MVVVSFNIYYNLTIIQRTLYHKIYVIAFQTKTNTMKRTILVYFKWDEKTFNRGAYL